MICSRHCHALQAEGFLEEAWQHLAWRNKQIAAAEEGGISAMGKWAHWCGWQGGAERTLRKKVTSCFLLNISAWQLTPGWGSLRQAGVPSELWSLSGVGPGRLTSHVGHWLGHRGCLL